MVVKRAVFTLLAIRRIHIECDAQTQLRSIPRIFSFRISNLSRNADHRSRLNLENWYVHVCSDGIGIFCVWNGRVCVCDSFMGIVGGIVHQSQWNDSVTNYIELFNVWFFIGNILVAWWRRSRQSHLRSFVFPAWLLLARSDLIWFFLAVLPSFSLLYIRLTRS